MTTPIHRPLRLPKVCLMLLTVAAWGVTAVSAQPSAFVSVAQPMAVLPSNPQYVSVADSQVYAYVDRLLMVSRVREGELLGFTPDTLRTRINDDINYIVRRPNTESYYYTLRDRKGRMQLYSAQLEGRRYKSRRIEFEGFEPEHPVFSSDGRILIFTALSTKRGMGGYDLWYSRYRDGEWQRPVNLGERINTAADEVAPFVIGNYLFFASNGHDESKGRHNLYATRLVSEEVKGDTIGILQIGNSPVQRLPEPFNVAAVDCRDLVYDAAMQTGFWRAGNRFVGFGGDLFGEVVWGRVTDGQGTALAKVQVSALDEHRTACSVLTDAQGFYRLCLPAGRSYTLLYQTPGHFSARHTVATRHNRTDNLMTETRRDVVLEGIPVGRPLYYADLFGPNASVELSAHGIEVLDRLVRFLGDNPTLSATFLLSSDLTTDAEFNALLTARRLLTVEGYLRQRVPDTVELLFDNLCEGREGCSDATGENRLTVVLRR